ncbi:putative mitochondrial translation system component Pet127p [[Candida] anglica]|uniref:Mitochondrial translation system component Pet127p n=1 Tax=[Candida] anglica TaxID=148631 RepID=A0ABP0E7Q8_9ASCO
MDSIKNLLNYSNTEIIIYLILLMTTASKLVYTLYNFTKSRTLNFVLTSIGLVGYIAFLPLSYLLVSLIVDHVIPSIKNNYTTLKGQQNRTVNNWSDIMLGASRGFILLRSSIVSSRGRLHTSNRILKGVSGEEANINVSSSDLSNVLISSRLKVSRGEIKNIDKEIEVGRKKISTKYADEINNNVLPSEVQKAIEIEKKESSNSNYNNSNNDNDHNAKYSSKKFEKKSKKSTSEVGSDSKNPALVRRAKKALEHSDNFRGKGKIHVGDKPVIQIKPLEGDKVPRLAHNLDRALFSPGVHFLQDPRTRVFNFPPYLKNIIKLEDFDFESISAFTASSKDKLLLAEAVKHGKQFFSSTSSMTGVLSQFYLFFNQYNPENEVRFGFPQLSKATTTLPASVIVQPKGKTKDGRTVYSIDSDKSADTEIVLSAMGHVLETLLTTSEKDFESFKVGNNSEKNIKVAENIYNYAAYGNFIMRSQLDCYDERLPGNGTFDLKTRAVCAIRYDNANPDIQNNTYQIWKSKGRYESFQREHEDLIKTGALLKYGFQARIGQMDGIYVAYHNINSFFGFEYLPLSEIDKVFFSDARAVEPHPLSLKSLEDVRDDEPTKIADMQFKQSLELWDNVLQMILKDLEENYKDTAFRLVVKAEDTEDEPYLRVFASPMTKDKEEKLQDLPKAFKTSFRADIPLEKKIQELTDHRDELIKFENGIEKSFSYKVHVQHVFGNFMHNPATGSPYPRKGSADWKVRYIMFKEHEKESSRLQQLMVAKANMLLSSYEKKGKLNEKENGDDVTMQKSAPLEGASPEEIEDLTSTESNETLFANAGRNPMRIYSAIGKLRSEQWKALEENPVVYKPKNN